MSGRLTFLRQGTARSFTPRIFTAAWRDTSDVPLVVFMLQRVDILCSLLLLAPTRASQLYELASLVVEDESPEPDLTTDHRRRRHGSVDPVDSQACSEAPVISRLTTNDGIQWPNPRLSVDASPIQYGGIKYDTKLPRAALALSKPVWPTFTLLHNSSFQLDLNDLDDHLRANEKHLHLQGLEQLDSADVVMIVTRFPDGTLFPDSNGLQNGQLPPGTMCVVRSALLKEAAQRAMMGDRRDEQCKCIRRRGGQTVATVQDAFSIVVWKARMKVIDTPIGEVALLGPSVG